MSAPLTIERYTAPERFLAAAQEWLLEAEVENNLLLGIALNLRGREAREPRPYWLIVRADERIVACACRTPPNPLVLSHAPATAIARLATELSAADPALSGVTGPETESAAFASAWTAQRGGHPRTRFRLRLHELSHVTFAGVAKGGLRKATTADLALAREWTDAYVRDTGITPSVDIAQRLIDREQLFLWIDGREPRAMVAATRETRSGCSINGVYTPPHFRRHGYATAAVAALSGERLAGGLRFCCLYTDATNPTSNSIYAKIGYRPIRDDVEIAFDA
ncbi:MAG TPA: GNAT family N-acetyltransferase [Gammaproteobacteria bacterium]|nr:GNAT family N-acetyltransferase [Gammaproteobacteria bacterium]